MGCVYSQPKHSQSSPNSSTADNPRVFHVCNVDDRGTEVNFGKIEITDNELALHQKGRNSIYWSLRSLRRYGFDAELFSFECGRRCPTGPGIYAFKCTNAEQLFNTLQEAIQQCTNTQYPPMFGSNGQQSALNGDINGLNQANITPPEVGPRYPLRSTAPHLYSNDIHEYINSPFYVNTPAVLQTNGLNSSQSQGLPTTRTDINTNYAKLDDLVRFYVNIKTPAVNQLPQLATNGAQLSTDSQSPPQSPKTPTAEPVNYIMLDLDQSSTVSGQPTVVTTAPATPVSKTPTMDYPSVVSGVNCISSTTPPPTPTSISPPMPYAQIDFAKTVALSNSAANHRKL